ncbi:hypothetical protein PRIPAC_82578 [Pristionchus pacificus]|nr:hypothetical protein PRIPAC_82578 [Pristionchus pacificus]
MYRFKFESHDATQLLYDEDKAIEPKPTSQDWKWFFSKKKTAFVGSVDRELIKKLCEINCTDCKVFLIEIDGTPKTDLFGNLFCAACTDVSNRVVFDNTMLKDFYDAVKCSETKIGYRCTFHNEVNESCNQLHSMHNLVSQRTADTGSDHVKYGCVWHARTTQDHKLMLVDPEKDPGGDRTGHFASLDRFQRRKFACFYHCACCSTLLQNDTDDSPSRVPSRDPVLLECGHIVGSRCVFKVLDKERTVVYCLFCDKEHTKIEGRNITTPSTLLLPLLGLNTRTCALRCKLPHPVANIVNITKGCRWCTLEKENKMGITETINYLWKFSTNKLINGFTIIIQRGTVVPAQNRNAIDAP